jgi:hypothetical protein
VDLKTAQSEIASNWIEAYQKYVAKSPPAPRVREPPAAVGHGLGNQAIVAFKSEPIAVSDVLSVIERLCGGPAGWQYLQRKAKFVASP